MSSRGSRTNSPEEPNWQILLAAHLLSKTALMRLNLLKLLEQLEKIIASRQLSLSQEGLAIWGASIIHRTRSEQLLKREKELEVKQRPDLLIPPIIDLPVKPGMLSTTILEIVHALKKVLESTNQKAETDRLLQTDLKLDNYLVRIEEELEEFIRFLEKLLAQNEQLPLMELFRGVERIEAARRFILLLIAAGRGVIELVEDEQTGGVFLRRMMPSVQES